ncbi:MAG: hypothetical protein JWR42_255 [Marmoricola sp.]|nr:hypothetical protein [Marmoricola sp.]
MTTPFATYVSTLDCSEYSAQSGSQRCQEQGDAGVGLVVLVLLVLGVAAVLWVRRLEKRAREDVPGPAPRRRTLLEVVREWPERRRQNERERAAAQQRLLEEYLAAYEAGDPDVRETARDFYDNDNGVPWKVQVGLAAGLLVLGVSVALLILPFEGIKHLTS